MNITDVDDKIIRRVRETGTSLGEFTGKFEAAFFDDLKLLNCRKPQQTPRATGHIPEIIILIEKLVARGLAYQTPDGSAPQHHPRLQFHRSECAAAAGLARTLVARWRRRL